MKYLNKPIEPANIYKETEYKDSNIKENVWGDWIEINSNSHYKNLIEEKSSINKNFYLFYKNPKSLNPTEFISHFNKVIKSLGESYKSTDDSHVSTSFNNSYNILNSELNAFEYEKSSVDLVLLTKNLIEEKNEHLEFIPETVKLLEFDKNKSAFSGYMTSKSYSDKQLVYVSGYYENGKITINFSLILPDGIYIYNETFHQNEIK